MCPTGPPISPWESTWRASSTSWGSGHLAHEGCPSSGPGCAPSWPTAVTQGGAGRVTGGLTGLPGHAQAWARATVQTCVVHLIRAATRNASLQGPQGACAPRSNRCTRPPPRRRPLLKPWRPSRPASWAGATRRRPRTFTDAWDRFTPFLAFPPMLRRVISPPLRGRHPLHELDRVAELPAAQDLEEPGPVPL